MQFRSSHLRAAPRRPKSPVYCVGWRAFVNWPRAAGETHSPVPMTDEAGKQIVNDLADGQEVEILSWRPHARASVSYQIRRSSDGSEWWVAVEHLRRRREPAAPLEATGAAPS